MLALCLALLAGGAPGDARPVPPRPGLSWEESDSLGRKLETIERRPATAKPETIPVTQIELNSYLNLGLGPRMPPGLADVDIQIFRDWVASKGILDLDQLKGKLPPTGALNPITYLRGRVPLQIRFRFPNGDGFGNLEFEEIRLGGYSVPVSLLQQMVQSATKTAANPQGFDILAPFRLPYQVRRVRLEPQKASLEF